MHHRVGRNISTDVLEVPVSPTGQHLILEDGIINHLTPNDNYMGRTAQRTSRCCILYIYSTNIRTEYFKHAA